MSRKLGGGAFSFSLTWLKTPALGVGEGKKLGRTSSGFAEVGIQTQWDQTYAPGSGSLAWPLTLYVTLGKAPVSSAW